MTDSGQPTEDGPGARTRADLGLPVHRRTRAVSPQSGSRTRTGPTNLEAGTGPARRACKEPQSDLGPGQRATLTLRARTCPRPARARAARQGQWTWHGGPGSRTRGQCSSGPPGGLESSTGSPGPAGPSPFTGHQSRPQPAGRQGWTRKTRLRRARRTTRGRGESLSPGPTRGTLNRESVTHSHGSLVSLQT
jgi:hypothetical protein